MASLRPSSDSSSARSSSREISSISSAAGAAAASGAGAGAGAAAALGSAGAAGAAAIGVSDTGAAGAGVSETGAGAGAGTAVGSAGAAGAATTDKLYLYNENDINHPPRILLDGYRIGAAKNEILYLEDATARVLIPNTNNSYEKSFNVDRINGDTENNIFSGIINDKKERVIQALKKTGWTIKYEEQEGDWIVLLGQAPNHPESGDKS